MVSENAVMTWYEEDVKGVIESRNRIEYQPKTVFYGSSTIRLWDSLYDDFGQFEPVNLGFGGSTLAACIWFFDDIVAPLLAAERMILYAGDNDLGDGRHPEEVCIFYRYFVIKLRQHFKDIPLYFISIKPSFEREDIMDKIVQANRLIEDEIKNSRKNNGNEFYINVFDKIAKKGTLEDEYFDADGLHLNKNGYGILKKVILDECLLK